MTYYPDIHHRRSIRLDGYDYSQKGAYYITICTHNRECLFGDIDPCPCPEMILNNAGKMIENVWKDIPEYYHGYTIDEYIIMPNHIHGIICNVGADTCVCPDENISKDEMEPLQSGQGQGPAPTLSISDVIGRFKTMTLNKYIYGVRYNGWEPFNGKLWQRNYHEHIIRNEEDLNRIRQYIIDNPKNWDIDENNPNI